MRLILLATLAPGIYAPLITTPITDLTLSSLDMETLATLWQVLEILRGGFDLRQLGLRQRGRDLSEQQSG